MGPCSEMVYNGYVKIPDEGTILRTHGFDLRFGTSLFGAWLCCLVIGVSGQGFSFVVWGQGIHFGAKVAAYSASHASLIVGAAS